MSQPHYTDAGSPKRVRFPFYALVLALWVASPGSAAAARIPRGAELMLRLQDRVASDSARVKDPVTAIVIAPVLVDGEIRVGAGARLHGEVAAVRKAVAPDQRAELLLTFHSISAGAAKVPIKGRVVDVDNARELVDDSGKILGILASETLSARIDKGIAKIGQQASGLGDLLEAAKNAVIGETDSAIDYPAGTELIFRVLTPFDWNAPVDTPKLVPIPDEKALFAYVNQQPFQTTADDPPKPSDITNLMFIGTQEQMEAAFKAAGWTTAHAITGESMLETVRAIAELRGYKEAPMSILRLEGRPPDLAFQKTLNTFAERHHLRIWRRPGVWDGKPVWVSSSTHDTGIEFSDANSTFIHKIDPRIDRERAKIVSDLLFTGRVRSLALVERPEVPRRSRNATGDDLITDGRMAVVIIE